MVTAGPGRRIPGPLGSFIIDLSAYSLVRHGCSCFLLAGREMKAREALSIQVTPPVVRPEPVLLPLLLGDLRVAARDRCAR